MKEDFNVDALLKETASHDNAALPFTQWKETLLDAVQKEGAQDAATAEDANVLPFAPRAEQAESALPGFFSKRRRLFGRITAGVMTAAAALLIVLGTRSLSPSGGGAAPEDAMPFAGAQAEAAAGSLAPEAADGLPIEPRSELPDAAPFLASIPEDATAADSADARAQEAIDLVLAALDTERSASDDTAGTASTSPATGEPGEGTQPYAVLAVDYEASVESLDGETCSEVLCPEAYIVFVCDESGAEHQYLVDASDMRLLGKIVQE